MCGHEKAPVAPTARALGNVETIEVNNVMTNHSTTSVSAKIIPFRQKELLLVDNGGEPFVPMKPVVDGMGLDWKSQYAKLQGGRFNSTMVMITTVAGDGRQREMACLPLRKLAGWLMSIHASKVRPDLRDNVIAYQNECDDALWAYWNDGLAVRRDDRSAASVLSTTIGTDGFHVLGSLVAGKVRSLPTQSQRRATMKLWAQVHAAFNVRSAEDIPADQLDSARNFIAAYALEGEWLPKAEKPMQRLDIHYPVEKLVEMNPHAYNGGADARITIQHKALCGMDSRSLTLDLLRKLSGKGYEVEACRLEVLAMRQLLTDFRLDFIDMARMFEGRKHAAVTYKLSDTAKKLRADGVPGF
jgi:hypothetical protein